MFRNYLLIAYRNIVRHKLFTVINIFGLSLSMSLCLLVIMQISKDIGYDHFHPQPERTYRVITELSDPQGNAWKLASSPLPLRDALTRDKVEVVQLYPVLKGRATEGKKTLPVNGCYTDPAFFRVFGFRLAKGNPAMALQLPNSIVLSHETARRFFGNADAMGRIISMGSLGDYLVTGVFEPQTADTHIRFDAYASASTIPRLEKEGALPEKLQNWNAYSDAYTYLILPDGVQKKQMSGNLERLAASLVDDPSRGSIQFHLQPLDGITPSWDDIYNDFHSGATWGKIMAAAGIAFIILLSACFNYTNLSIARSLTRAKEVGIRKVSGATRLQIFGQYIMEAVLISLFSLMLAWLLLMLNIRHRVFDIIPETIVTWQIFLAFLGFSLFTGLLAGSLPAWILSAFNPAQVLKSMPSFHLLGRMNLRKGLLIFQLSVSLVITVFLFAFYRQFTYMADADPGFDATQILSLQLQGNPPDLLMHEISALSGVENVAATSGNFGRFHGERVPLKAGKEDDPVKTSLFYVDRQFIPMMGLQFLAGNNFLPQRDRSLLIINEKAAATFGFKTPFDAVGQRVWLNDSSVMQISGVLKNFHFENMGVAIAPLAFRIDSANFQLLNIKVNTGDKAHTMNMVAAAWQHVYPGQPLQAYWLSEKIHEDNAQKRSITTLGVLALMAIVIALMGLLAMVIYTTELRRKEIGIRKVMGAGSGSLMMLLSRGFIKLLLIAGGIALPAGYLLSHLFLQNFALRTPYGLGSVMLCFFIMLFITLLTIISQTWKAARVNPADSLRSE
ncbi:ABC transporter permease [Chitinophaga sp. XS-30]|uniref:ABC transporter permease n=1 Tax=Chitinophaga sp. XS-30 TaxID=2604421 RepID=UPI0011DCFDD0|nr:ABC transporter permease [Chitinophaga sp. XS-30]QEH42376.1 FtsX-like permease family protein [Chitinophaga sp. XS-30]